MLRADSSAINRSSSSTPLAQGLDGLGGGVESFDSCLTAPMGTCPRGAAGSAHRFGLGLLEIGSSISPSSSSSSASEGVMNASLGIARRESGIPRSLLTRAFFFEAEDEASSPAARLLGVRALLAAVPELALGTRDGLPADDRLVVRTAAPTGLDRSSLRST